MWTTHPRTRIYVRKRLNKTNFAVRRGSFTAYNLFSKYLVLSCDVCFKYELHQQNILFIKGTRKQMRILLKYINIDSGLVSILNVHAHTNGLRFAFATSFSHFWSITINVSQLATKQWIYLVLVVCAHPDKLIYKLTLGGDDGWISLPAEIILHKACAHPSSFPV